MAAFGRTVEAGGPSPRDLWLSWKRGSRPGARNGARKPAATLQYALQPEASNAARYNPRRRLLICAVSWRSASSQERTAQAWTPGSIPWQAAAPNGTKYALLEGSREKQGGTFTYAFFIPAGVWDGPHKHSSTARVFVVQGALGLGFGDRLDRTKAAAYPKGDLVLVPGGATHFDGADVDTIIIGVATGPWSTTYLDGSKPASAGTPITPARPPVKAGSAGP